MLSVGSIFNLRVVHAKLPKVSSVGKFVLTVTSVTSSVFSVALHEHVKAKSDS